jgi:hypothetical protein
MSDSQDRISALPPVRELAAGRSAIHEVVAAMAALRPAAIALRQAARTLDYGQLDARARAGRLSVAMRRRRRIGRRRVP